MTIVFAEARCAEAGASLEPNVAGEGSSAGRGGAAAGTLPEKRPADAEVGRSACGRGRSNLCRKVRSGRQGAVRQREPGNKAAARAKRRGRRFFLPEPTRSACRWGRPLSRKRRSARARRGQRRRKRRTQDAGARPHPGRSAAEAPRKRGPEAGPASVGGVKSAPKAGPALRYLAMRFFQATERMPSRMVQGLGGQPGT